jgi:hypothetical protein
VIGGDVGRGGYRAGPAYEDERQEESVVAAEDAEASRRLREHLKWGIGLFASRSSS